MKQNLRIVELVALFCTVIGCTITGLGQPGKSVGGYRETSKTDETVVAAANFAVASHNEKLKGASLELTSIERAERQIVAGSNYRICLALKSNERLQQATAIVYLNLQNKFSLSNWANGNCAGSASGQSNKSDDADESSETVSYKGSLEMGKLDSLILYLGEESGDYAAFCFTNKSAVGRAVLAACRAGEQCEFVGKVDFDSSCQIKNLAANLSASGKITSIESVKLVSGQKSADAKPTIAPDVIVRNLYAAQKAGSGPFFQNSNRAAVDKYFAKDFADLIWKDAITATDGVGALDADPLFHAQDSKITAFLIGKPVYDKISRVATVLVSFKNFGKAETVKFLFAQDDAKTWKITNLVYSNGDMLKSIFS